MTQPYSFERAKEAQAGAEADQRAAERWVIDTYKAHAAAERSYRQALSEEILRLKADGMAATTCADVARGLPRVADLRYRRDIAEGMREAAGQATWRASANRKAEQSFLEWSLRRDLADAYSPPDGDGPTYSGRRV